MSQQATPLSVLAAQAARHFGLNPATVAIRYGAMPAQWDGYALRNLIVINPHHVQALDVLVCHEMRHIWQYHTGAVMRFDLPYPDQPHEQDARAHQFPCATAIARQPVMASPVQPQATTLARLSWASPVDTTAVRHPDPTPATTAALPLPDSALFSVAVLGLVVGGLAVRQKTGSQNPGDTVPPAATRSALGRWLATVDWGVVYRVTSRLLALAGLAVLTYTLLRYARVDGLGALGSAGQYAMGAFFTCMTFVTGSRHDGFNLLFLAGLLGIVVTF